MGTVISHLISSLLLILLGDRDVVHYGQSIKRSSFFGARSRSALLIIKKSGAPVFAPPIKKERALAPAQQKLERAHFALFHFLCIKMC